MNDKFWSILAMPIGVMLCFGPAILAWLLSYRNSPTEDDPARKHQDARA